MFSVWRSARRGDYFLTDGESENVGDQTVEDSVEAISDGEDIGFTEEPIPEEERGKRQSRKQRILPNSF